MRFCYTRTEDGEHQKQISGINVYCAVSNHNKIRTREQATKPRGCLAHALLVFLLQHVGACSSDSLAQRKVNRDSRFTYLSSHVR